MVRLGMILNTGAGSVRNEDGAVQPRQRTRVRPGPRRRVHATITLGLLLAIAAACGAGDSNDEPVGSSTDSRPSIVATTGIWADVVANIACDGSAAVETIVPDAADPHDFEPSLADRARLDGAALIVANGLGLEALVDDAVEAAAASGTPVIRMTDHVVILESAGGDPDPHIWLDPTRVSAALPALATALVDAAGLDAEVVSGCLGRYQAQLSLLDEEITDALAVLGDEQRIMVTDHDALGYYADRYGFEIVGAVVAGTSTLGQPSAADLQALADAMAAASVSVIFVEVGQGVDDVAAVADRVGDVAVVPIRAATLGPPDSGADTYVAMLRTTTGAIVEALR